MIHTVLWYCINLQRTYSSFEIELLTVIQAAVNTGKSVIFIGDFNIDLRKHPHHKLFEDTRIRTFDLKVTVPVNESSTNSNSQIDLCFSNCESLQTSYYESYYSYHKPIMYRSSWKLHHLKFKRYLSFSRTPLPILAVTTSQPTLKNNTENIPITTEVDINTSPLNLSVQPSVKCLNSFETDISSTPQNQKDFKIIPHSQLNECSGFINEERIFHVTATQFAKFFLIKII